jgi:hypothetical protein
VANPKQTLEVDIDMLSPDFYTVVTTSAMGVGYNASASGSHGETWMGLCAMQKSDS